jgi:hypothetical protein
MPIRTLIAVLIAAIPISTNAQNLGKPPDFAERINEFFLQWQQLPERRSYWAHTVMDSKGPGSDRNIWFDYLYRVALSNDPTTGRRVRVDGLRSQFSQGALKDRVHDLVLLGKHLTLLYPSPDSRMDLAGVQTQVLDKEDKDAVPNRTTSLYAFDPFWVSLGNYTTVKSGQATGYKVQTWSQMHVVEERARADGTYLVLVLTPNGKAAAEVTFSNSKEHFWAPIEYRAYSDAKNKTKPESPKSITRKQIERFDLVAHTKTEWAEIAIRDEKKLFLPKKYVMYQSLLSGKQELDVVIDVGGWKFDKDVPVDLLQEEKFLITSNDFKLEEGKILFDIDEKNKRKK